LAGLLRFALVLHRRPLLVSPQLHQALCVVVLLKQALLRLYLRASLLALQAPCHVCPQLLLAVCLSAVVHLDCGVVRCESEHVQHRRFARIDEWWVLLPGSLRRFCVVHRLLTHVLVLLHLQHHHLAARAHGTAPNGCWPYRLCRHCLRHTEASLQMEAVLLACP
jgi:hypothetical protein